MFVNVRCFVGMVNLMCCFVFDFSVMCWKLISWVMGCVMLVILLWV